MKKEVGPGDFVGLRGGQGIFTNHFIYKIRQHIFKVGKKEEEESMKVESEARNKASPQPPKKRPGILISTCYGEPRFWLSSCTLAANAKRGVKKVLCDIMII